MARLLAIGLVRVVHAWAWTVFWLFILTRTMLAWHTDVVLPVVLAVVFMPLIYAPLLAWRYGSDGDADDVEDVVFGLGAGATFLGSVAGSALLLGFVNFLVQWSSRGPGGGAAIFTAVVLHIVVMVSITLGERFLKRIGRDDDGAVRQRLCTGHRKKYGIDS